jgi:hypothetical protein
LALILSGEGVELLRLSTAVQRPGIRPMTFRQWAIDGRILFCWVGCEGRFSWIDVENMKRGNDFATSCALREVLSG